MRILLFANNWVGWQIAAWLQAQKEEIVGLVLHPRERRKHGPEIIEAAGLDASRILDGSRLDEEAVMATIKAWQPSIGISALFGYILRRKVLDLMPSGCLNVHPAFLPYNRGAFPNVWSIIEGTPAGATIHYIDEGVDTGDLVAQRGVAVEPVDTGETLYRKLEHTCVELFKETWPLIRRHQAPRVPQPPGGTRHFVREVAQIDEINLDRTYSAREFVNLLRARTFPPYPGAFFRDGQRKVYLQLQFFCDELTEH
jgi:methionyl-tRNA formyltransferase